MKTIGIVAHSAEGGARCFLTACREGASGGAVHAPDDRRQRGAHGAEHYHVANSTLPVLDSTRLLAKHAVFEALKEGPVRSENGWLAL